MARKVDVVRVARDYIGTPVVHQGRVRGPQGGVDCIGLVQCVARDLGLRLSDQHQYRAYRQRASANRHGINRYFEAEFAPVSDWGPGDILAFWTNAESKRPQHLGIAVAVDRIVHAHTAIQVVMEQALGEWRERIVRAVCFKEVA